MISEGLTAPLTVPVTEITEASDGAEKAAANPEYLNAKYHSRLDME